MRVMTEAACSRKKIGVSNLRPATATGTRHRRAPRPRRLRDVKALHPWPCFLPNTSSPALSLRRRVSQCRPLYWPPAPCVCRLPHAAASRSGGEGDVARRCRCLTIISLFNLPGPTLIDEPPATVQYSVYYVHPRAGHASVAMRRKLFGVPRPRLIL